MQNISYKVHDWTVGQEPPNPLRPIVERQDFQYHGRSDSPTALLFAPSSSDFMEHSSVQELNRCPDVEEIPPQNHTEPECSLLCLPEIATGPFPEPD
jgi:hypothetical protein